MQDELENLINGARKVVDGEIKRDSSSILSPFYAIAGQGIMANICMIGWGHSYRYFLFISSKKSFVKQSFFPDTGLEIIGNLDSWQEVLSGKISLVTGLIEKKFFVSNLRVNFSRLQQLSGIITCCLEAHDL